MLLWAAYPVSAEIYQYKDESGKTHYTNDPVGIPKQYQKDVHIQGETVTYPEEPAEESSPEIIDTKEETGTGDQETEKAPAGGQVKQPQPGGNSSEVDALRAQEEAFENERKALLEERAQLDEAMKKAKTKEDIEKVNAATIEFNLKSKDFQTRRQAFKEEVTKYNEQVRKDMEQKLQQYKTDQAARLPEGSAPPESE
jgi:chromosome segregation ATPase